MLVVDQFEESFTAGGDGAAGQAERGAFIAVLHAAATVPAGPGKLPPALVVAAVRADFLGRLIAYPPLKSALESGPFTVGPMSEAELRLAITGPAAEAGVADAVNRSAQAAYDALTSRQKGAARLVFHPAHHHHARGPVRAPPVQPR